MTEREQGHTHRWLLPPDVTAGLGRCRDCGAEREFRPEHWDKPIMLPKAAHAERNMQLGYERIAVQMVWWR